LIAQMSPLRGELEVIVDGIYDDEEVRLEFWPGFKYANGDFSPLHVNSPIKEAWEPEPIENGGRKFFIPYGDFSVVGILEGQFPEFDIFNIPRDNSAYLDFSGTSVIEGVVYDPYGNVLGNQKVQLGRDINGGRKFIDAVTDGNGMFYFDRLKEGSFNVSSFFGPTMYSAQQNLDIEDGTITTVELQFEGLESIMGQAYGMDSVNGAIPLKNLKIEYCVGSSDNFGRYGQQFLLGFEGTKHLDEQGRFNFWHDPSIEKWGFKVTSPGYFPVTLESLKDLEHIVLEKEK